MKVRAVFAAVLVFVATLVWLAAPARADGSGPTGQWYLNSNGDAVSASISTISSGVYTGTLVNENGGTELLDRITWDGSSRLLQFRRNGAGFWEWYSGRVVEGILVGRFSRSTTSPDKPPQLSSYSSRVSGWNRSYLDTDIVPRVWEILIDQNERARLRIDKGSNGFMGRLKVYSTVSDGAGGEQPEYDLDGIVWDGTDLIFTQHLDDGTLRTYQSTVSGRDISGTYSPGSGTFSGTRAEVLTYGVAAKNPVARGQWIQRTRVQLYHLMMADNPDPLSRTVTVLGSNISPTPSVSLAPNRDDNPGGWPQDYTLTELRFDYTLANPYGGALIARSVHAYLATPNTPPPAGGRYPALLALNGHGGSAWTMMNPDDEFYWYGDSYARRGYVVLAVDISHRPLEDRANLYSDYIDGDDPDNGNGPHPAVKAAGFDSDWEEDGERSWDAMRSVDYLLSLPNVDPKRIVISGLSMGGEVTAITGGLDPRIAMSVPAGYSPDLGVMLYNGNHPCWQWQHADVREYVDVSDYFALTAPRPLLIETGKEDWTYSSRTPPFSSDKQVARRNLTSYNADTVQCNLYLHYDWHHYHVGDINPTSPTEQGVRIPDQLTPAEPWTLTWQIDASTHTIQPTLFDLITSSGISSPNLSTTNLSFGNQTVGTISSSQPVTVTNNSATALTISSLAISSGWSENDNCLPSLAGSATCTINVSFAPTATGSQTGTLTLTDNAPNSPQLISLSGTGVAPVASLSQTSLTFPAQFVGTTGQSQNITLTNIGDIPMTISSIQASGDFRQTSGCTSALAVGTSCTISVSLDPSAPGTRNGTLTITDNALGSPQTVHLSGTGVDFEMSSTSKVSVTIIPGQTATYTLTLSPQGGLNQTINLACSGAPSQSGCTVTPSQVTLNRTTPVTVRVSVSTTAGSLTPPFRNVLPPNVKGFGGTLWLVSFMALASLAALGFARKRRSVHLLGSCLLILIWLAACGGWGSGSTAARAAGTPLGTYTLDVRATVSSTGTSAQFAHDLKLTLTVN